MQKVMGSYWLMMGEMIYSSTTLQSKCPGYKTLKAGQLVTFDTTPGEKGLHAIDITPISNEDVESMKNLQGAEQNTQHHSNTEQATSPVSSHDSRVAREGIGHCNN